MRPHLGHRSPLSPLVPFLNHHSPLAHDHAPAACPLILHSRISFSHFSVLFFYYSFQARSALFRHSPSLWSDPSALSLSPLALHLAVALPLTAFPPTCSPSLRPSLLCISLTLHPFLRGPRIPLPPGHHPVDRPLYPRV